MLTMQLRLEVKNIRLKIICSCVTFLILNVSSNKNWAWCRTTNRPTNPTARLLLEFFAIHPHLTCDRQGRPSLSSPICLPAICNVQYRIYLPANRHNFCRHIHQIILVDGDSDKIVQVSRRPEKYIFFMDFFVICFVFLGEFLTM